MIKKFSIEENNLAAVKCTNDFGGPNMWNLYIKNVNGFWEQVQWMNVQNIQQFFNTTLPVYNEVEIKLDYTLV